MPPAGTRRGRPGGVIPHPAADGASMTTMEHAQAAGWLGAAEAGHRMRPTKEAGLGHATRGPRQGVG